MYKEIKDIDGSVRNQVIRIEDSAIIPFDTGNIDYREYLKWLAEGNTPQEADDAIN
jgi:hypothetical protein